MRRLDEAILALAERVAHRLQRRTGLTGFSLAKLADLLMVFGVVRMYRLSPLQGVEPLALTLVIGVALYVAGLWYRDKVVERFYMRGPTAAHPVQLRLRAMWRWRMAGIAAGLWFVVGSYGMVLARPMLMSAVLMPLGLVAGLYFRSVIPLPPGALREHEGLKQLIPIPVRNPSRK